jgi:hypothetical protein
VFDAVTNSSSERFDLGLLIDKQTTQSINQQYDYDERSRIKQGERNNWWWDLIACSCPKFSAEEVIQL